jgi:hypothetical protein
LLGDVFQALDLIGKDNDFCFTAKKLLRKRQPDA